MTRGPKEAFGKPTQLSLSHDYQVHAAPGREPQGVSETLLCCKALHVELGTWQVIGISN